MNNGNGKRAQSGQSRRPALLVGAAFVVLAAIAVWSLGSRPKAGLETPEAASANVQADAAPSAQATDQQKETHSSTAEKLAHAPPVPPAQPAAPVRLAPTPETRALVENLVKLPPAGVEITPEQAVAWKQSLQQLAQHGPAAVPAIEEFLSKNTDFEFGPGGKETLGYTSVRAGLFDALTSIGGPEAIAAMSGVLQVTADPREVAMLAQDLEKLEPAQHRQEVVDAARQTLEQWSVRKLETADVAPLFEVLQKYGGSEVVPDLVKVTQQWGYYGPIALGMLPDNAGVPSLIQMLQDTKAPATVRDASFQMLSQLADGSPEARAALVEQARLNAVTEFAWRITAPVLAGDHVSLLNSAFEDRSVTQVSGVRTTSTSDNQHFFSAPASLTSDQVTQRTALIDELLSVTTNPTARQILQESRASLSARALQVAVVPGK